MRVDLHRLEFTGRVSVNSWTGTDIWAEDSANKDMGTLRSSDGPLTRVVAPHDVVLLRLDALPQNTRTQR